MNINIAWPSKGQWTAVSRHVLTFASGLVGGGAAVVSLLVAMHFITPQQSGEIASALGNISDGIKHILTGVTNIVTGVTSLIAIGSALWAAYSASKKAQAASLAAKGDVVVTDEKTAASVPSPNVVAATQPSSVLTAAGTPVQVVPK